MATTLLRSENTCSRTDLKGSFNPHQIKGDLILGVMVWLEDVSGTGTGTGIGTRTRAMGTICVSPCLCSGTVGKVLHKSIQPIHQCPFPSPEDNQCDQTINGTEQIFTSFRSDFALCEQSLRQFLSEYWPCHWWTQFSRTRWRRPRCRR